MAKDSSEFGSFIYKLAFQYTKLYLDDAKRVCVLVETYAVSKSGLQQQTVRQELMRACNDLVRKLKANRNAHPSLYVPESVRLLANQTSPELAHWNMACRVSPVAISFLADVAKSDKIQRGKSKFLVRIIMRSEPPPVV